MEERILNWSVNKRREWKWIWFRRTRITLDFLVFVNSDDFIEYRSDCQPIRKNNSLSCCIILSSRLWACKCVRFCSVQYKLESFRIVSVFAKLYIETDFSCRISNPYLPKTWISFVRLSPVQSFELRIRYSPPNSYKFWLPFTCLCHSPNGMLCRMRV